MISAFSTTARISFTLLFMLFLSSQLFAQGHEGRVEITAFPNPTEGVFTVKTEIPLDQLETILVTDLNGRVIHGFTLETGLHALQFDLSEHEAGTYLVHLIFHDEIHKVRVRKS